jgi:hypothetical protein
MTTGYTCKIEDGSVATGKDFLWLCVRNFGACVTLRDNFSAPIPEKFEVSHIYEKNFEKARKRLDHVSALSLEEAMAERDKEFAKEKKRAEQERARRAALRLMFEKVFAEVKAWKPPTSDHRSLKNFAVEQLREGIAFDCDRIVKDPVLLSVEEWLAAERRTAEKNFNSAKENLLEETRRVAGRNDYLAKLRASLNAM